MMAMGARHQAIAIAAAPGTDARPRLASVDVLRGLVMVVMALDHVRDFFGDTHVGATDLQHTTVALFLTRWITHFCAPVFVLLAGTSAFLWAARGRTTTELSWFLLTRGVWLVFLELTVVRFGWFFNLDYSMFVLQVIWAIGASMVILSALVFLPTAAVAAGGIVLIAGHNLLDGVAPERFGAFAWLWCVLHVPRPPVIYPLVPWVGVMAAGYGLGAILLRAPAARRRQLSTLGVAMTAGFVFLRYVNGYGDPSPWAVQTSPAFTALSFINVTKYPPSLLYLLMTLGPAIAALPALDRLTGPAVRVLTVYGRVPLFYYVLHIYLIHALAIGAAYLAHPDVGGSFTVAFAFPKDYGFGLPLVYVVWLVVVSSLYLPCRWFAGVKQRRHDPWLSYL
jgi:uncharacterized membrane protein